MYKFPDFATTAPNPGVRQFYCRFLPPADTPKVVARWLCRRMRLGCRHPAIHQAHRELSAGPNVAILSRTLNPIGMRKEGKQLILGRYDRHVIALSVN